MTMDPDGLWPRRADAANDGLDEDRDVDDITLTLEDEVPIDSDSWTVDADDRSVDFDDSDERDTDRVSELDDADTDLDTDLGTDLGVDVDEDEYQS